MTDALDDFEAPPRFSTRQRLLAAVAAVVVVGVIAWGIYWLVYGRYFESTDDAYVGGDVVAITSREPGTILALHFDNTQFVHRGDIVIDLDPAPARIGMLAAEAELAQTVRQTRALFSKAEQLRAQITQARVQLAQAQADYGRRISASGNGAVSREEVSHAGDALAQAKAALTVTQTGLAQTSAQIQGTTVADNPDVLAAAAKLRNAALVLDHMHLYAPVDGVVAQRTVQVGEQIAPGTPLLAIVPLTTVWVDANFKEVQLKRMRMGQPATLTADIYGGGVTYHGYVEGLSPGTGSTFALLPPQNATGNWIKIVQRVPVRIAIDPADLSAHPLRVSLSVDVTVDVRDQSGPAIAARTAQRPFYEEAIPNDERPVNALIAKLIADNEGPPAPAGGAK
jgi:membrane fusion protein, multidrug efflux system